MLAGLFESIDRGFGCLRVESDSKLLVDMVYNRIPCPWNLIHQCRLIQSILSKQVIRISHVMREINSCADFMAGYALSSGQELICSNNSLPSRLRGLVALDAQCFPHVRVKRS